MSAVSKFWAHVALAVVLLCAVVRGEEGYKKFWVCDAGDAKLLGEYLTDEDNTRDGAQVWTNQNELSVFRNSGVWYIGDLAPWPPATHYRCDNMEGCSYNEPEPSTPGMFSVNPRFGKAPAPTLSLIPCGQTNDEL